MALLEVRDLKVQFRTQDGPLAAVDGVSFSVEKGETLAIVGESGSGKSVSSLAVMGLVPPPATVSSGELMFEDRDLNKLSESDRRRLRGDRMAMVFQDPMSALNPFLTVGRQLTEVLEVHRGLRGRPARRQAVEMLSEVGLQDPERRFDQYAHELSGGMRQRTMIAMALLLKPALLFADEPTTALDVTLQAQILALLEQMKRKFGTAIVLITHDLGVVAGAADRVAVMYAGRIVELGSAFQIFNQAKHPYTQGLLMSVPRMDSAPKSLLSAIPGQPPDPTRLPSGCPFRPRCPLAMEICAAERPRLVDFGETHLAACHAAEMASRAQGPALALPPSDKTEVAR